MNKKNKVAFFALLFAFALSITGIALADVLNKATEEGKIIVNKTATVDQNNNRKANVKLSIGGNKITKTKTLDVVLVIDRSTSMNDPVSSGDSQTRMEATKTAADSLVTKLLSNNTTDEQIVKMGIVTFGTDIIESYRRRTNSNNYETVYITSSSLSGDAAEVKKLINNIPNNSSSLGIQWTNVQSGIEKAGELLENSTADEKIIILLSDGEPNRFNYNGKLYGTSQSDSRVCVEGTNPCKKYMKASEAAKNTATFLKTETSTTKAITIYTIGYGLGDDTTTKDFLKEVATSEKHAFVADKTSELEGKFNDIVQDITTIASNAVVTDIVPNGFVLDEDTIKEVYGDKVTITKNDEDGTTTIEWNIGNIQSIKTEELSYSVVAKDDYYGGMYTNVSAILEAKAKDNPAYPSGNVEEVFSKPIVPISVKTNNDNYSTKLGENLVINTKKEGILNNDSNIKMTDGDSTTVSDEIVIKSVSCGNKSDITMNNDGTFTYVPNSTCYTGDNSEVVFEYEVKSTVTINGESTVVTSNVSTITIELSKDESAIENPIVTKKNNDGEITTSITEAFSYTIEYSSKVENHIGNTVVTIVDELPYELDETKSNELAGGTYNADNKTITWTETIENINSFENKNNEINIEKVIKVYYKNVPTDVEKIVNSVNVSTDIDNIPVNDSEETKIIRGNLIVEYEDNLGNKLKEDITSEGLINTAFETNADNSIIVDGYTYQLVSTKINNTKIELTNNYSGEYQEETITVTYVYYKVTGDITSPKLTKEGPERAITSSTGEFDYVINYQTSIDNYIGDATVTIIDELPYKIDESKSSLDGGIYDEETLTITWIETESNINTYEKGVYSVNIEKEIKLVFINLDATKRELINKVTSIIETSKSEVENNEQEETRLEIKGTVITHYKDTNGNTIDTDVTTKDLVGNEYTTSAKTIDNYQLVRTEGETTGQYIDGTIEVTYIYYEETAEIVGDTIVKDGTKEVDAINDTFNYEITYSATIKEYIGDAKVTIIDTLPLAIDEAKSNLDGGIYDEETLTITWIQDIENIDTNKDNKNYSFKITKNISVTYIGLEPTTREITNNVTGKVETEVTDKTVEDEMTTTVKIEGTVITHYKDTDGNTIAESIETTGLVGNEYITEEKEIEGYVLVETNGQPSGQYIDGTIEVTYIYYKVTGEITNEVVEKNGDEKLTIKDEKVSYTIDYNAEINDYIGNAQLIITDYLPLAIDITESDLDGGIYDEETLTITWIININDINTYISGESKKIEINKNLLLSYKELDLTANKITNKVNVEVKTNINESLSEDKFDTIIDVKGNVIVNYITDKGEVLLNPILLTGKIGSIYNTEEKMFMEYVLINVLGEETGQYIDGTLEVTYVYTKLGKGGDVEEMPPQTGVEQEITLFSILNSLILMIVLLFRK